MKSLFFTLLVMVTTTVCVKARNPHGKHFPAAKSSYEAGHGIGPQISFLYLSNTKSVTPGIGLTYVKNMDKFADIYSGVDFYAPFSYIGSVKGKEKSWIGTGKTIDVDVTYNVKRITRLFIGGNYYLSGDYNSEKTIYLLFSFCPFLISGTTETGAYDDNRYDVPLVQKTFTNGGFTVNLGVGAKVKLGKWHWFTDIQYGRNLFTKSEPEFSPRFMGRLQTGLWYPF